MAPHHGPESGGQCVKVMKDRDIATDRGKRTEGRSSTDVSLLGRACESDPAAWERLVKLYGPTVYGWCRRRWDMRSEDAEDEVQDVFGAVASKIATFKRERSGHTFRDWLWTVTKNKVVDHWRRRDGKPEARGGTEAHPVLDQVPAEERDDGSSSTGDSRLLRRALGLIRSEFEDRTWQAFWRLAIENQVPADVAADVGMTANSVYVAKCRVLRRLREELDGLVD